jgi:hypothetical protein
VPRDATDGTAGARLDKQTHRATKEPEEAADTRADRGPHSAVPGLVPVDLALGIALDRGRATT